MSDARAVPALVSVLGCCNRYMRAWLQLRVWDQPNLTWGHAHAPMQPTVWQFLIICGYIPRRADLRPDVGMPRHAQHLRARSTTRSTWHPPHSTQRADQPLVSMTGGRGGHYHRRGLRTQAAVPPHRVPAHAPGQAHGQGGGCRHAAPAEHGKSPNKMQGLLSNARLC